MKKYLITAFLIALTLLLTAQEGCRFKRGSTDVKDVDIHTGYQGIVINFLQDAPPLKMYEDTNFKIALELRNKGTCDVGPSSKDDCRGYVQIEGFDPSVFNGFGGMGSFFVSPRTGIFAQEIPDIPGKSVYNAEGGYDIISFPSPDSSAYAILPEEVDSYKPTILATACYRYVTEATPIVCVDPDPYGIQIEDKVCTLRDVVLTGGQGAPVAVTKVEESVITTRGGGPQYIQFKIFVENKGNTLGGKKTSSEGVGAVGRGIVMDPDAVLEERGGSYGCGKPDYLTVDTVRISGELSGVPFNDCRPDNYEIKLDKNGRGFIICTAWIPSEGSPYTAPLHIRLDYGYINTVSRTTEIVQTPGE